MSRNCFLYVLDRTNGKLISAEPFAKVNWADRVDLVTGRPIESEVSKKLRAGETVELWPGIRGAKNWPHAAFNPNTGLLYANTNDMASFYKFTELAQYKAGSRYQGIANRYPTLKPGDVVGHIEAIDPMTAKPKWRVPLKDVQIWSAMLATGSGLLFNGKHSGEFFAMDAETNAQLLFSGKVHKDTVRGTWIVPGHHSRKELNGRFIMLRIRPDSLLDSAIVRSRRATQ
jgi:alcohol dehydrogenase (cytochrome c)